MTQEQRPGYPAVAKMPADWHEVEYDSFSAGRDCPVKNADLYERNVFHSDRGPFSSEIYLEMRNTDYAMTGNFKLAHKELKAAHWPFDHYGLVGIGTRRTGFPGDNWEMARPIDEPEKAIVIDLQTFRYLFHKTNLETTLRGIMEKARKIVKDWNATYGGSKKLHNRVHIEDQMKIISLATVLGKGKHNRLTVSDVCMQVSSYEKVQELQHEANAVLDLKDLFVHMKVMRGGYDAFSKKAMAKWGMYMPLPAFTEWARSSAVASMVQKADAYLNSLVPSKETPTFAWFTPETKVDSMYRLLLGQPAAKRPASGGEEEEEHAPTKKAKRTKEEEEEPEAEEEDEEPEMEEEEEQQSQQI